jgi:hypothetical protein
LQPLEQLPEEALGRLGVASALDQDVEHGAVLVDRPPEIVQLAADAEEDLIQVPLSCLLSSDEGNKEHPGAVPGQRWHGERARQEAEPNRRRLSKL